MKRYWFSFELRSSLVEFCYHGPWWISGYGFGADGDEQPCVCMALMAESEESAKAFVLTLFDAPPDIADVAILQRALRRLGSLLRPLRAWRLDGLAYHARAGDRAPEVSVTPRDIERLREGLRRNVWMGCALDVAQATADALLVLLRRDWAVRVLDADAVHRGTNVPQVQRNLRNEKHERLWSLFVQVGDERPEFTGTSPDAARLVAAQAVWPELSKALTAEQVAAIGEAP